MPSDGAHARRRSRPSGLATGAAFALVLAAPALDGGAAVAQGQGGGRSPTTAAVGASGASGAATSPDAALAAQDPSAHTRRIAGVVIDRTSGEPLPGAEVLVLRAGGPGASGAADAAPLTVVRTDARGAWQVVLPAEGSWRLRVRRIGYLATELPLGASPAPRVALVPQVLNLDATVVTASRRIEKLRDAPVAVALVGQREIRQSGASDLATVLSEQAGLPLEGGTPSGVGVQLQGLDSRRVLILVDGQPIVGRINGMLDLSRLPIANVARIEVVKGPQSTLYGSDAMGGVINLITREPAPGGMGGGLAITGGTQGRLDFSGTAMGAAGPVAWTADAGRRTVSLVPGQDGDLATLSQRWDGAGRARWRVDSSLTLESSVQLLNEDQRWRAGPVYFFADRQQAIGRLGATWQRGRTRSQSTLAYTMFDHLARRGLERRPSTPNGENIRQRLLVGETFLSRPLGGTMLDGGVQLRHETAESPRVPGGMQVRSTAEPYAQATIGGDGWSLVPGLRLTADRVWGTHFTPRVAAMWRPSAPLALRLSAGRGFRAPDFNEQFIEFFHADFGYRIRGNPALRPELSDNVSGSVELAGTRLYLRADLFANRFHDFIESRVIADTSNVTFFTYDNVGRGFARGLDLEAVLRLGLVRVDAGWGALRAWDAATDLPLLGRPRANGRLGLSAGTPGGLTGSLTGVWTGRTPVAVDVNQDLAERTGFLRVNARAAQTVLRGPGGEWRFELGVNNLFETRPQLWPGFTGRQLYTGLSWRAGRAVGGEDGR